MVDTRKIAILGAGRIGESLISGLLSSGWREPAEVAATARRDRARRRAARALRRRRHALEPRRRGGRGARRHRGQAAGHRGPARRDRHADPSRADGPLRRSGDPDVADREPALRRRARRARDAEHAVDRARGHRRALAPERTPATSTSTWPRRRCRTSAPSFASPRSRSTPSRRSRAPGLRTSRSSPRR